MTIESHDSIRQRRPALRRSGDRFLMMMSRHREFLEKQRGFLQEKLSFVEDELKNIEAFLGRSAVEHTSGGGQHDGGHLGRRTDQKTIKSYIFEYLAVEQEGLTTAEMLERIRAAGRTDYDLLHLRAYLYRLGNLGFLIRKSKRWLLVSGFDKAGANNDSADIESEGNAH